MIEKDRYKMKYYGIEIAGVKVTSANCNNITGSRIKGKVSYNPETNTLTLDNATINGGIGFFKEVEDITITLVGENTIKYGIGSVTGTKTINGTGSLNVTYIGCIYEKNTIIEDCTIDVSNNYGGTLFSGYGNSKLTIRNANVSAQAIELAIGDFADIELIGCKIVEPTNAQIVDTKFGIYAGKYICNANGTIANKVVIKKM